MMVGKTVCSSKLGFRFRHTRRGGAGHNARCAQARQAAKMRKRGSALRAVVVDTECIIFDTQLITVSQHVRHVVLDLDVAVVAVERLGGALEALPVRERPERVADVRAEA